MTRSWCLLILGVCVCGGATLLLGEVGREVRSGLRARGSVTLSDVTRPLRLSKAEGEALLDAAHAAIAGGHAELGELPRRLEEDLLPRVVLLSLATERGRALTQMGAGFGVEVALSRALAALPRDREASPDGRSWLRLDVVESAESAAEIAKDDREPSPGDAGLALYAPGASSPAVYLPGERIARGILDADGRYAPDWRGFSPGTTASRFTCASFVRSAGGTAKLERGSRAPGIVMRRDLLDAASEAGEYLSRSVGESGLPAAYDAVADVHPSGEARPIRAAVALAAMYRLYGINGDDELLASAESLCRRILERDLRVGTEGGAAVVEPTGEVKLGAVALTLIALTERRRVTGVTDNDEIQRQLGHTILSAQNEEGRFRATWTHGERGGSDRVSRSYPPQAVLALMRLSEWDDDSRWIDAAERGLASILGWEDSHGDHGPSPWLIRALEAVHRERPRDVYLEVALNVAESAVRSQDRLPVWPDLVGSFGAKGRTLSTAVRVELLIEAYRFLRDYGLGLRADRMLESACLGALYLMRTRIGPEWAMLLATPASAHGAFREGLLDFDVRADTVAHVIEGLLSVRGVLREEMRDGIGREAASASTSVRQGS